MINLYSRFVNSDLNEIRSIIEKLVPNNKSSFVEQGSVFLSEGIIFYCSVDLDESNDGLFLSGGFKGDIVKFEELVAKFQRELDDKGIIYDIEYEVEKEGEFTSFFIKNSGFDDAIRSSGN